MPEIAVFGFEGNIHRASGILDELRVQDDKWILDLASAIAIHRSTDGTVVMDQSYQPTGRRATEWGGILGFFMGASLSIPSLANAAPIIAEGVITSAALARVGFAGTAASFWTNRFAIPPEWIDSVGRTVLPGDSAIFAVIEAVDPAPVVGRLQRYGGTIARLALSSDQQKDIERVLADGDTFHQW